MQNKNTVVVYQSNYGSAKRYAEWISEQIGCDMLETTKTDIKDLLKYDTIVYGGSLYAVGILGIALIKNNFDKLRDKKVIVFSVGASPAHPEALEAVKNSNFTDAMKESVHYFHLRGGFDFNKLNLLHKVLMFLMKVKIQLKKKENRTNDEKGMLASYSHPADWTNKKSIAPIVECINS
jgi:flavodoxin